MELFLNILHAEFVPALGCTEPASVALCAAKAKEVLGEKPEKIVVKVSANVLKNGMGVGIPGTKIVGLEIAAALGAFGGKSDLGLQVLSGINVETIVKSEAFVLAGNVQIEIVDTDSKLYVEVAATSLNNTARVVIKHQHQNIILIEQNGSMIFQKSGSNKNEQSRYIFPDIFTVKSIYHFATNVPIEKLAFLKLGVDLNMNISTEGMHGAYGIQFGKNLKKNMDRGVLGNDIINKAIMITTAASDARMAGSNMPVMSNSGSGNQGISVSLPVAVVAKELGSTEENMLRALAMALLIAVHMKQNIGPLSALCGVFLAASGASAGITFLMGGKLKEIEMAISNMTGGLTGMICDGAKFGCSIKIASGVGEAVRAALLAIDGFSLNDNNGIVASDVESTIANIGKLATDGMGFTDEVIIRTMLETRQRNNPLCL